MPENNTAANRRSDHDVCEVRCFHPERVRRLRAALPGDAPLEATRALFGALADGTRLRILHALREGDELCVCDVANVLGSSVASASHHLRKLRSLGLVRSRVDGKMTYYALDDRFAATLVEQALGRSMAA